MADPHAVMFEVRLFGPQAQLAGRRVLELDGPADGAVTAGQLLERIAEACPALAASAPASRVAVDHRVLAPEDVVDPAAEVALIGLISGG
ncbi:MAG: MoaD/ThiS family protein [Planctomycetota bacterium]